MPRRASNLRRIVTIATLVAVVGATTLAVPAVAAPTSGCHPAGAARLGYSANLVDHTVSVIDLETERVVDTITGFEFPWNVEVSPDGSKLFVDDAPITDQTAAAVLVVDVCTKQITKRIPTLGLAFSTISPDRRSVFATNLEAVGIQQIDTTSGEVVATYGSWPLSQEAVSADGQTLWVVAIPGLLYSIDMRTGRPFGRPIYPGLVPAQFTISPDGSRLAVADLAGQVAIVDTAQRAVTHRVSLGGTSYPSFAAVSPDNDFVWVGCYSGKVAVLDLHTGEVVKALDTGGWVAGVSFTADSDTAYVSTTPTGSVVPQLGAAYLAGVLLSTWRPGGEIRVIDTHTYEQTGTIAAGNVPMKLSLP